MFKISFQYLNKNYSARVQKITQQPVQFIVSDFYPHISYLPDKLVYQSHPQNDQLVYQSFNIKNKDILITIGQTIFTECYEQKIKVHS